MAIFLVFLLVLLTLSQGGKMLWETKKSWNTEFRLAGTPISWATMLSVRLCSR